MKIKDLMSGAICTILILFTVTGWSSPNIVVCEGKYVMGDLDSKRDAKALALMEAKRVAMEQAGTYLESSTEVKDYELSKDQINTLAAGVIAVEILKEDWKMSGENMMVTIQIRATIDSSHLEDRITSLQDSQTGDATKDIQAQLAELQKELAELKARDKVSGDAKTEPSKEVKEKHENLMKKMSALDYMEQGNIAIMNKRWRDAESAYNQAIAADPKLEDAYAGLSITLHKMARGQDALAAADRGLAFNPNAPRILSAKAAILKDQPEKINEALKYINLAIAGQPDNPRFYLLRGEIYLQLGNDSMAMASFRESCKLGAKMGCIRMKKIEGKDSDRQPHPNFHKSRPNKIKKRLP